MNGRTWLVVSCAVAVVFCAAAASPATPGCPVDPGTPVAAVVDPDAAAAVPPDFWTPERMRQAGENTMAAGTTRGRVSCSR